MNTSHDTPEIPLLTVREVATQLRVDDTTVRRWIKSGALEAITLPHLHKRHAYRIRQDTLNNILADSVSDTQKDSPLTQLQPD